MFTCVPLTIEGVLLLKGEPVTKSSQSVRKTYCKNVLLQAGIQTKFVQDNEARSGQAGTLRGLHYQIASDAQTKLVRVLYGKIFDVVVDLRKESLTFGQWCSATLSGDTSDQLYIPAGFAHGYCTLVPDTLVVYKVDKHYAKTSEAGIRWDDENLAICWPMSRDRLLISDKDAALPTMRELFA